MRQAVFGDYLKNLNHLKLDTGAAFATKRSYRARREAFGLSEQYWESFRTLSCRGETWAVLACETRV